MTAEQTCPSRSTDNTEVTGKTGWSNWTDIPDKDWFIEKAVTVIEGGKMTQFQTFCFRFCLKNHSCKVQSMEAQEDILTLQDIFHSSIKWSPVFQAVHHILKFLKT